MPAHPRPDPKEVSAIGTHPQTFALVQPTEGLTGGQDEPGVHRLTIKGDAGRSPFRKGVGLLGRDFCPQSLGQLERGLGRDLETRDAKRKPDN